MVLRFSTKILKDHLFHEPFHKIPVFNDAMSYRPLEQKEARWIQIVRLGRSNKYRGGCAAPQNQGLLVGGSW